MTRPVASRARLVDIQSIMAALALFAATTSAVAYNEAPMLAELVRKGQLPPVEQRLPEEPLVVEPVHSIGKYGGTWRRLVPTPYDTLLNTRLGYEPLVRWDRSGRKIVPNIATSWEIHDGGRTYIFHLRKGIRWSDGHPFTAADFIFWYEDIILNKELTPALPTWFSPSGNPFTLTAPDPYTLVFHFERPNGIFLEVLGFRGHYMYQPAHYLKQFHVRYTPREELDKQARERGLQRWHQLFQQMAELRDNPDLPTIRSWRIVVPPPANRLVAERNPYYWKVDPEGNQLPYIDRIAFQLVQNSEVLNLKAMEGETDMQARRIDPSKYTLFKERSRRIGYRVQADRADGAICIYINNCSKDPDMRPILQDRRFRIALSVAINRDELIEFIYGGLAEPTNAVSDPLDPYYLPEFGRKHIQYDPDLANRLLDEVGLVRGSDGWRRLPNGRRFKQILYAHHSEAGTSAEVWQLVVEYWREVGLDFTLQMNAPTLSRLQARNGNLNFWAYGTVGLHWIIDPIWYVPINVGAYYAPLYGRYVAYRGQSGVPPSPEFQRLIDWYTELAESYGDEQRKLELGRKILAQWAEQCYVIGIVQEYLLTIVADRFKNVPDHIIHSYRVMTPGYLNPEQFYIDEDGE